MHVVAEGVELPDDLGELARVERDHSGVVLVWNCEVFRVNGDQTEVELSEAVSFLVLECDFKSIGVVVRLEGDRVVIAHKLHDFGQVLNVDAECAGLISAIAIKPIRAKVQRNESNMRAVHGLN